MNCIDIELPCVSSEHNVDTGQKASPGLIQASLCKIHGLLKDFPTVFKD